MEEGTPTFSGHGWEIFNDDAAHGMAMMPEASVDCIVTSPPYWMARDYGTDGQIGLEDTLGEYLDRIAAVFMNAWLVLKEGGTLWLNMGDTYASGGHGGGCEKRLSGVPGRTHMRTGWKSPPKGLKHKDLVGLPWRIAFMLQELGWTLRSDIIWHKPNPIPEAVKDRPTKSHEYLFLLSKGPRYHCDMAAIAEPASENTHPRGMGVNAKAEKANRDACRAFGSRRSKAPRVRQNADFSAAVSGVVETRNARTVWRIPTQPRSEDHWASFPDELARRCILAGCPEGGTVLDPFAGRGTTIVVALRLGRKAKGIELNPDYCRLAAGNVTDDAPLLNAGGC